MSTHTPGPLEILDGAFGTIIVADDTNDIAEFFHCDEATVSTSREEALANARLFVASQKLLEALKVLVSERAGHFHTAAAWDAARAAIASVEAR